jgi:hypothetical protein
MSYSTPKQPFTVTPARVDQGPVWLICDGHDTIVATCFDPAAAEFFVNRLNGAGRINPLTFNPYISAMLAAFRLHLEHELGEPLLDQSLPIGDLLIDLADWFSLCTGERALALGPDLLVYDARQGDRVSDQLGVTSSPVVKDPALSSGREEDDHIRIIALDVPVHPSRPVTDRENFCQITASVIARGG